MSEPRGDNHRGLGIAVGRTVIKAQRVTEPIGGVAEKPVLYA
jgi:hypothetical protein